MNQARMLMESMSEAALTEHWKRLKRTRRRVLRYSVNGVTLALPRRDAVNLAVQVLGMQEFSAGFGEAAATQH